MENTENKQKIILEDQLDYSNQNKLDYETWYKLYYGDICIELIENDMDDDIEKECEKRYQKYLNSKTRTY